MFDNLSDKLGAAFKKLKGHGKLSEKNISDGLRDVRMALLEADVHYKVVKQFITDIKERALGQEVKNLVEGLVDQPGVSLDKRFVYYLLASTGICVVPISSFCTPEMGFRITLLERNEKEFTSIFERIGASITAYLQSAP